MTPLSKGARTQSTRKPPMIDVSLGKHGAVIIPNLLKKVNGDTWELYGVPKATTKSVGDVVLRVHRSKGTDEASRMVFQAVNIASA